MILLYTVWLVRTTVGSIVTGYARSGAFIHALSAVTVSSQRWPCPAVSVYATSEDAAPEASYIYPFGSTSATSPVLSAVSFTLPSDSSVGVSPFSFSSKV